MNVPVIDCIPLTHIADKLDIGFFLNNIILVISKIFTKSIMGIHPDRVDKLMISTNIIGAKLHKEYPLNFSLAEAITDWFNDCNNEELF